MNDRDDVVEANTEFYDAFESLEIERMTAVWARESSIKVVHPGWPLLTGWEPVMQSWELIFENASMMSFTVDNTEATVEGDWAWVSCTEHLMSVQNGQVSEGKVQTTNIFKRTDGRWLMVHHHGSPSG